SWIGALFIVPVIIIVLVLIYVAHRRSRKAVTQWPSYTAPGSSTPTANWPAPSPPEEMAQPPAVAGGLAEIKAHDPSFDEDAFLATAERCFFAVEEAWSQQRPELSQPVMSDEAWQRQKAEIASYRSSGRRGVLDNLTVAKAVIMAAGSKDGRDEVTVRFRAASANYDVDVTSGKVVHGNHQMAFWEQEWVFQRSSQASTGSDSTEGNRCPNCGAPLDLDIAGVCKNCKTAVGGSDGRWVVVRADQPQHVPG
ncbi:MAG TPA: TIM44-like domain-containing protein, partial [Acidimicrobiales bacterium]|nr:TIM44-like domain-containing protein [Acidimicrobiales bacterium]